MTKHFSSAREKRPMAVREMFDRIARSYDLLNRLITFGRDDVWRRYVVRKASLCEGGRVLDVGTGTGRIAFALLSHAGARVVAVDFSREMLDVAKANEDEAIAWVRGDALSLPVSDASFDAVVSGYLVRNVPDPIAAFREQARVLKKGGRAVCLETSTRESLASPFVRFYLRRIIPFLGGLIARDRAAYSYLPKSAESFLSAEELARAMEESGFEVVEVKRFMFGTQVVITAQK